MATSPWSVATQRGRCVSNLKTEFLNRRKRREQSAIRASSIPPASSFPWLPSVQRVFDGLVEDMTPDIHGVIDITGARKTQRRRCAPI
jgi:hypothetical protein